MDRSDRRSRPEGSRPAAEQPGTKPFEHESSAEDERSGEQVAPAAGRAAAKLDREQFARLLSRAMELEAARADAVLSEEDLLEAGRELGLSESVVREVHAQFLAEREREATLFPQPHGTRIRLEKTPERLRLWVPAVGPKPGLLAQLGLSLFMLAFISFWTFMALHASFVFAAFSTPFWIAGTLAFIRALRSMLQSTEITLGARGGSLVRRLGPFSSRFELDPRQLLVDHPARTPPGGSVGFGGFGFIGFGGFGWFGSTDRASGHPGLVLHHGTRSFVLLAEHTEVERRWVGGVLEAWLDQTSSGARH